MDLLPIHYKFRFTFSEQDKTHEYADQIPRWKQISVNLTLKLLSLYTITKLTGGIETLNKDGDRTWCHLHLHFDAIENKEAILKTIKRYLADTYDQLKQKMGNTTGAVTYELMNSLYPWNRDSYIIKKHRVFKMRPLAQVTSVSTDHNALANPQYSNAPAFQRFVQNIPISKKLIYADQNTTPSNDWVGVAFYIINGDGTNLTHGSNPSHRDL